MKYTRGRNVAQADSMFEVLLLEPRGDMFWMFPVIGAYLHGKDKMSPRTKAIVRNAWKTYTPYRGDTENHWCMYYASLFLAAEQWPGLPGSEWYNGKSSNENRDEAKGYLIQWMRITTTIGQGEFDSPDYFPEFAIPMLYLAQFAEDKEMRERGQMMCDYLFADFAAEHLDGQYIGGFSRIYQPAVYKPLLSQASGFAYLYFGTGQPTQSGWVVFPALSPYRLPEIIYNIAVDRTRAYVHKEKKRVRNVIRMGDIKNPPVYKYTYMTKDYGLSSLQGGILQPIQQHTWSVRYTFGRPYSTIFGLHPYWSSRELATFFPEEEKTMMSDVVASKGTYNNPDKWTGSSPYERTFQNKNTLIVLYDIEPGTTAEHIDGFFPMNLEERTADASGWIVCKAGETFVAWYPLQEYEWIDEYEKPGQSLNTIGRPETGPEEKPQGNWRLRSHKLQNGYVVEARSKSEVGSFEEFQKRLRSHIPKAQLTPGRVSVQYVTLDGDRMSFSFPEGRILNGKSVDLKNYKLFDGPFLKADVGSEKLTIQYKKSKRVLDFKSLRITE
ncbi:MAG: hypothetical protein HYY49_02790 [Ignavibacteriales bacterium]|nr:hypothetical protein [Ignavibacteriales bacterium]